MDLTNTLDTHIKAISTAKEWEQYKAMVAREDDMDYFKKVLIHNARQIGKTFGVPESLTQNNKAMKYRVKTDLLEDMGKGDEISSSWRDRMIQEGAPESWFEPVEQVQEGDYFKRSGAIYRVMGDSIYKEWNWKVLKVGGDRDMPNEDDYKTHQIEHRKLSTYEIEQVLKKECHNRYKKGQRIETVCGHEKDVSFQDLKYLKEGDSLVAYSGLQQGYITFYQQGNWAEAVDQTPHIEINGYEVELEKYWLKIGCSTIHKDVFRVFSNFVYDYELAVQKCGEDITDQIKKIANYYDQQQ